MPDPATNETYAKHEGGKPNFLLAVAMAAAAFVVFFIVAWFVLHHSGRHLLPNRHPDHEPHAYLQLPGMQSSAVHS
jgi:hypothetical protein